jgi:hypothetical protein
MSQSVSSSLVPQGPPFLREKAIGAEGYQHSNEGNGVECKKCGFKNSEALEVCEECGGRVTEADQQPMQPLSKSENRHALGAIPGIVLLFIAGPVFVYFLRVNGSNPDSSSWLLIWFWATTMTFCAIALLGAMVFRYCKAPSGKTRSLVAVAFISVSAVCLVIIGLILLFGSRLDLWRQYDPLFFAFSFMIVGIGQGAVAAIEWNRLGEKRGIWRVLSMAMAIPAHVFAVVFIVLMLTVRFGTS